MPQSLQATLDFLTDLRFNNYREWFEDNRKRYDQARAAVEALVAEIIGGFGGVEDLGKTTPRDCLFRIHRDVRFSKDKTPYKTAMGIVIGNGGRKSTGRSYYLHIEPAHSSFIAAGVYDPTPEQLKAIRAAIAEDAAPLRKIIAERDFAGYFGGLEGERLKTPPKGYSADHAAIDLLKHKQFLASHALTDEDVLREDFAAHFIAVCAALKPLESYFQDIFRRMPPG
ncbi:MAG: DUF2461 domain-containing protein [Anaerolineae bacterium]|nr:DUF2461 domain-containing protein [Anaerolineae bacterium]